jgi:hypothetical protein
MWNVILISTKIFNCDLSLEKHKSRSFDIKFFLTSANKFTSLNNNSNPMAQNLRHTENLIDINYIEVSTRAMIHVIYLRSGLCSSWHWQHDSNLLTNKLSINISDSQDSPNFWHKWHNSYKLFRMVRTCLSAKIYTTNISCYKKQYVTRFQL